MPFILGLLGFVYTKSYLGLLSKYTHSYNHSYFPYKYSSQGLKPIFFFLNFFSKWIWK